MFRSLCGLMPRRAVRRKVVATSLRPRPSPAAAQGFASPQDAKPEPVPTGPVPRLSGPPRAARFGARARLEGGCSTARAQALKVSLPRLRSLVERDPHNLPSAHSASLHARLPVPHSGDKLNLLQVSARSPQGLLRHRPGPIAEASSGRATRRRKLHAESAPIGAGGAPRGTLGAFRVNVPRMPGFASNAKRPRITGGFLRRRRDLNSGSGTFRRWRSLCRPRITQHTRFRTSPSVCPVHLPSSRSLLSHQPDNPGWSKM